jgi:hypothetical protein
MAKGADGIVQVRIDLRGFKPPIWRRAQVPGGFTLYDLHDTIQALFGWEDDHLHKFVVGGQPYQPAEWIDDPFDRVTPEDEITLAGLLKGKVERFTYVYDFGDDWTHDLKVEKWLEPDSNAAYPALTGGRRMAPLEDCGGPGGFEALLQQALDPDDPNHEEAVDWLGGGPIDPASMDRAAIERRLAGLQVRPL